MRISYRGSAALLLVVGWLLLTGCRTAENPTVSIPTATPTRPAVSPTPLPTPSRFSATIDTVAVDLSGGVPTAVLSFVLPDSCTVVDEVTQTRTGSRFQIQVDLLRTYTADCQPVRRQQIERVPLDMETAGPGFYIVDAADGSASFTFDREALLQLSLSGETGTIDGRVWHDLCPYRSGESSTAGDGCVQLSDGTYAADGVFETAEPPLDGVVVTLGQGGCPAPIINQQSTGTDGRFRFDGLLPGRYCLAIRADSGRNQIYLMPGVWTAPQRDGVNAQQTIDLTVDDFTATVDFGWDYALLPRP